MNKIILALLILFSVTACKKEEASTKNFVLTGNIEGLKEGKIYIQRIKDTVLVPIDSIIISGNSNFKSEFNLDSPEMLYLFLDRGVSNSFDNNIAFFAEPGKLQDQKINCFMMNIRK